MIGNAIAGFLGTGVAVSASSFESIATATGTGSSGTITFSSIPSTYSHLQLRILGRADNAAATNVARLTINNDTGANYAEHVLTGEGTTATATGTASTSNIPRIYTVAASTAANIMSTGIIDIIDYASTSKYKTVRIVTGDDRNGTGRIALSSGLWQNTAAVNRVDVLTNGGNWTTATTIALYGIKG
jgi:hypothetical protein